MTSLIVLSYYIKCFCYLLGCRLSRFEAEVEMEIVVLVILGHFCGSKGQRLVKL